MVFSLIGMLFSVLTASRYMAYASPFVLEYTLIILHERYLKKAVYHKSEGVALSVGRELGIW